MAARGPMTTPAIQALLLDGATGTVVGVDVAADVVFDNMVGLGVGVDEIGDAAMVVVAMGPMSQKIPQVR